MLKGETRGKSMISAGIVGTPFQSYSPNSASRILVKTLVFTGPPIAWTCSRARTIAGSSTGTPAIFIAKYALMVTDSASTTGTSSMRFVT